MSEKRRFDLKGSGITDVDVDSFTLRRTNGVDENTACDLVTRLIPLDADARKYSTMLTETRVALAVVEVNDKAVDPGSFPEIYLKYNDRTRSFIYQAWMKMNAVKKEELDKLFGGAAS